MGYSGSDDSWQTPEQWLAEDNNDPGHQLLSDDEIVAMIRSNEDDSGAESGSDIESQPSVSHAEACNAFSTALKWLESQGDIEPAHLLLVKQWRDLAARKRCDNLVQPNLLKYFSVSN